MNSNSFSDADHIWLRTESIYTGFGLRVDLFGFEFSRATGGEEVSAATLFTSFVLLSAADASGDGTSTWVARHLGGRPLLGLEASSASGDICATLRSRQFLVVRKFVTWFAAFGETNFDFDGGPGGSFDYGEWTTVRSF